MNGIYLKTKIYSGEESLITLKELTNENIWIICDKFLIDNGKVEELLIYLNNVNKVSIFSDVVPDPPLHLISKGVALSKSINPTTIIGYGGGSAIDTAKAIIYFARQQNFIGEVKFIAIPTTSGTGSEVTSATVITDTETKTKHIIFDDCILPDEAILDPRLTLSVPPIITANTGLDVLTHAIEAYVSVNSNAYSDALAEKSVELLIESLVNCYKDGENILDRKKMQEASNLAGIAFNISGLGINHSIAHQIGGRFKIAHGLANAILLSEIIDFNSKDNRSLKKYAKLAYKTGLIEKFESDYIAIEVLKKYISYIMDIMNMPNTLSKCGIDKKDLEAAKSIMAKNALKDGCTLSNPRNITEDEIENILLSIY